MTRPRIALALAALLALVAGGTVHAACNLIPGTTKAFRGTLGTTDRPFASPGTFVDLTLDPICHTASPGLAAAAGDHVVTIVFTPPHGAPRNVVAVTTDCAALESRRQACAERVDVDTATCVEVNGAGEPVGLELEERDGRRHLRVLFPDTDAVLAPPGDALGLAGPATLAVTALGDPLPCALAAHGCAAEPGLLACVDDLLASDGSCDATPNDTFGHFTALPPPNDYAGLTDTVREVRFTIDARGNLLVPMNWRGVLLGQSGVPVARLLRGSSIIEAFEGGGAPVQVPGLAFLGSFSPEGGKLPPVFDPQVDPGATDALTLFGSVDAPTTVLRVARRSPAFRQCVPDARPCTTDAECGGALCGPARCTNDPTRECHGDPDCPGGECGFGLFDFSTRLVTGVGPVLLRIGACLGGATPLAPCTDDAGCPGGQCGAFVAKALDPVPLDGFFQTVDTNAFVIAERLAAADLNLDGDRTDDVVKVADRRSGLVEPIGAGGASGRAVARIDQPPFTFPAVAIEEKVVAFLEPEPAEGPCGPPPSCDKNGDGDVADTILRVYRLGPTGASALAGGNLPADARPLLDGQSLVVSDGLVFFRTPEAALARQRTLRASLGSLGEEGDQPSLMPAIAGDGLAVAFQSFATTLVPPDTNRASDTFERDLGSGLTARLSVASDGTPADGSGLGRPALSADGRVVAFDSSATTLLGPGHDTNRRLDVFVHEGGATTRVSVGPQGAEADGDSFLPAISSDGRLVAFESTATNLVSPPASGVGDVYVHDRMTGVTTRVSVDSRGAPGDGRSFAAALSADGRLVAFQSLADNLVPDDTNGVGDVFVHDRMTGATERVSIADDGTQANADSVEPALSAAGRLVAFASFASNLVIGDTNGVEDVFVHDRVTGFTTRVSLAVDGDQADGPAGVPAISADGRRVAFESVATNLVPGVVSGTGDVYVRDRASGLTSLASAGARGAPGDALSAEPALSADGGEVAFASLATNLVDRDLNHTTDIFVRGTDPDAAASDLTGDGDLDDTLLQVLDTRAPTPRAIPIAPATSVAVARGTAAFLSPERALGVDLDGDGDTDDEVVQLYRDRQGGPPENLGQAATAIALSDEWLAALVSERAQGSLDRNGDGDAEDEVVAVRRVRPAGSWINLGQAADSVGVSGSIVAFITPEAAQGSDLNGDGDLADRVLQFYDAAAGALVDIGQAAVEFELGADLVAFRTPEADQGHRDLNGDGDISDAVLQVYDLTARRLLNTGQAAIPCRQRACDPRIPYRVLNDTVKFLTLEAEQGGEDLDEDGDAHGLVLQTFNLRLAERSETSTRTAQRGSPWVRTRASALAVRPGVLTVLAGASAGLCTSTALSCATAESCPEGTCFLPPGGCIRDLGTDCDPRIPGACGAERFCEPILGAPGRGRCHAVEGVCGSDADCTAPAICNDAAQRFQQLVSPLSTQTQQAGQQVFTAAGRCVEDPGTAPPCVPGQLLEGGRCRHEHGTCRTTADCPPGSACRHDMVIATAADVDADEIPDPFDNCPLVRNVAQEDSDDDGVGDACDPQCGSAPACDDRDPCTVDGCSTARGCIGTPVPGCTRTATTTTSTLSRGTTTTTVACDPATCDDGDPCTTDTCGPGGCQHVGLSLFDGASCILVTGLQTPVCSGGPPSRVTLAIDGAITAIQDAARAPRRGVARRLHAALRKVGQARARLRHAPTLQASCRAALVDALREARQRIKRLLYDRRRSSRSVIIARKAPKTSIGVS